MRYFPPEVIASWPRPNYDNPETRGLSLIIVNSIFVALAVFAVMLRVYARVCLSQWFGIDDLCIVLSLLLAIGMAVCILLANISYGWNRHVWDVPLDLIAPAYQVAFAAKILFCMASMAARLSLTFFYYRLVKDSGMHTYRIVVHCALVFHFALGTSSVLITIFQCTPIRAFWIFPILPGSRCLDEGKLTLVCGSMITFADFVAAALPIPMILRLKMPTGRRVGVIILLGLGFLVVVAGTVRTYFIWFSLIRSFDETWYCYPLWIAAGVETDLSVICACAPSFRLILHKIFNSHFPSFADLMSSIGSKVYSYGRKTPSSVTCANTYIASDNASASKPVSFWSVHNARQDSASSRRPVTTTPVTVRTQRQAQTASPFFDGNRSPIETSSEERGYMSAMRVASQCSCTVKSQVTVTTNFDVTSALWGSDEVQGTPQDCFIREELARQSLERKERNMSRLTGGDHAENRP